MCVCERERKGKMDDWTTNGESRVKKGIYEYSLATLPLALVRREENCRKTTGIRRKVKE